MKSPKDMRIIQIDITNACMYRCSNCTRFCGHHKKNFFMDFDTFKRAVKSLEGYPGTIGIMGGEPTLHPEFERFMQYLNSQLPDERKNNSNEFIYPQKDFIISRKYENREHSIIYPYSTGKRDTVLGAGLWTAMVSSYEKNYEIIQDTFRMQAVNDHGNVMYHSPILFTRKDIGLSDEKWFSIRDNCWAQSEWSATITPKGAFFCEIAGALDMLFDGPGGWPIEQGWWEKTPEEFSDQLHYCELCGICLGNFSRDANEGIDDMSQSMYEKLKAIGSPKIEHGNYNILKIKEGKIIHEDIKGSVYEERQELFFESFDSRFNKETCSLYPKGFQGFVILPQDFEMEKFRDALIQNSDILDKILIVVTEKKQKELLDTKLLSSKVEFVEGNVKSWGQQFITGYQRLDDSLYTVYISPNVILTQNFKEEMMDVILNPGTLQWCDLGQKEEMENSFILSYENIQKGIVALFNKKALSLRKIGMDRLANAQSIYILKEQWEKRKCILFHPKVIHRWDNKKIVSGKSYILYGTGKKSKRITKEFSKRGAKIYAYADSNETKWNTEFLGKKILSLNELYQKKEEYDGIIIASIFYNEIKETLQKIGIPEDKILLAD